MTGTIGDRPMSGAAVDGGPVEGEPVEGGPVDGSDWLPADVWTEILPGLWQGGTDDSDTLAHRSDEPVITRDHFDTVVTLHAWSNPVDWHVREIRQAFHDGGMDEVDVEDLWFLARQVFAEWRLGRRVLVRCLSGLNRSGLVVGMVLLLEGYTSAQAIALLRERRHRHVLCNPDFEAWLLGTDATS